METCLPGDDGDELDSEPPLEYAGGSLSSSVAINLSNSLSSLSVGSPTEKDSGNTFDTDRRHVFTKRSSSFKQKPRSSVSNKHDI